MLTLIHIADIIQLILLATIVYYTLKNKPIIDNTPPIKLEHNNKTMSSNTDSKTSIISPHKVSSIQFDND